MRSKEELKQFVDEVNKLLAAGTLKRQAIHEVAAKFGKARSTGYDILREAEQQGFRLAPPNPITERPIPNIHRDELLKLKKQIAEIERHNLEVAEIRKEIFHLASNVPDPPAWTIEPKRSSGQIGIPVAIWSDWHLGERVANEEVNGVNAFDIKIAEARIQRLVERTLDVCFNHMGSHGEPPKYPGLIINLLGDIVSGEIHHELEVTNEEPLYPIILRAVDCLVAALTVLHKHFPKIHVVCTPGNHGRNTVRPEFKRYTVRNADWLIATLTERAITRWAGSKGITFSIPESGELVYPVYEHRFLATHGDALGVRGGDGIIGLLGPICRGEIKVSRQFAQVNKDYDTALMGHWHQLLWLQRAIVNGCFPAGSLVSTPSGVSPIEAIRPGQRVISRDGSPQTVTNCFIKQSSQGLVHLKIRGVCEPLSATPAHLIHAIKGETTSSTFVGAKWDALRGAGDDPQWIPADFLSPGDYVEMPRSFGIDVSVDEETAWAYGLYLAEGNTLLDGGSSGKHNRITLTMHERELAILQRFADWFQKTYGKTPRVHLRRRTHGVCSELLVSPGRDICLQFRTLFGHRAGGKHLPAGALFWWGPAARALIQGWLDGDGHTTGRGQTSGTTISKEMAYQLFQLALNAGHKPSMTKLSAGGPRNHDAYTIHFTRGQESIERNGLLFYRIHARYRDRANVPVYDLEVSGEHTYVVNNVGVHNSLIGFNEYAHRGIRATFELPQQALFFVHPKRGITIRCPIFLEDRIPRCPIPKPFF